MINELKDSYNSDQTQYPANVLKWKLRTDYRGQSRVYNASEKFESKLIPVGMYKNISKILKF